MDGATGLIAAVLNPRTLMGPRAALWRDALTALQARARVVVLETRGDGADGGRVAALLGEQPSVVVAAGGDGTVRLVAAALHAAPPAPPMAILPFGTGNNVARALGLNSLRLGMPGAVDQAVAAIVGGHERHIDLGGVGDEIFVGSFALGMDAAILASRNAWCRRWSLPPAIAGYPLYLLSCAFNVAAHRAVAGSVDCDAAPYRGPIHDLLVVNTPLYAGEFRFAGAGDHDRDGRLDLYIFRSAFDYVRAFVTAWRRHVRHQRGDPVIAAPVRAITRATVTLSRPQPSQTDGEEHARAAHFEITVLERALRVLVKPPS